MPNKKTVDLSHWNSIPKDLTGAKSDGVIGIIHKATEGSGGADSKYNARRFLAAEASLNFGAYHFLRPGNMKDQARIFFETATPDPEMLLAADHEDARVSLADLQTWLEEVERLSGRKPVIYSGHVLKDQLAGKRHAVLNQDNYRLWLAQYSSSPTLPPGWSRYWLWQWTQSGSVAGIDPPVDLNDYQGSDDELVAEWSGSGAAPEPQPEPEPSGATLSPIEFQSALAGAGYYTGVVDGLSGPLTRAAVDDWFEDGEELELQED